MLACPIIHCNALGFMPAFANRVQNVCLRIWGVMFGSCSLFCLPLRFKESLFLLCRDLTSTFEVQSPHAVARIFLTGYPPILGMVYVSRSCCLKAIKIPPNFKSEVGECSEHSKSTHRSIVFLFGGLVLPMAI